MITRGGSESFEGRVATLIERLQTFIWRISTLSSMPSMTLPRIGLRKSVC